VKLVGQLVGLLSDKSVELGGLTLGGEVVSRQYKQAQRPGRLGTLYLRASTSGPSYGPGQIFEPRLSETRDSSGDSSIRPQENFLVDQEPERSQSRVKDFPTTELNGIWGPAVGQPGRQNMNGGVGSASVAWAHQLVGKSSLQLQWARSTTRVGKDVRSSGLKDQSSGTQGYVHGAHGALRCGRIPRVFEQVNWSLGTEVKWHAPKLIPVEHPVPVPHSHALGGSGSSSGSGSRTLPATCPRRGTRDETRDAREVMTEGNEGDRRRPKATGAHGP
jgi:hypothetical protein